MEPAATDEATVKAFYDIKIVMKLVMWDVTKIGACVNLHV